MLKNQHLLAAVVGLSSLSALFGAAAMVRESRTGTNLVSATQEWQGDRQRFEERNAVLVSRLDAAEARLHNLEMRLSEAMDGMRTARKDLNELLQKKPVSAEELAQSIDRLNRLEKRVESLRPETRPGKQ